MITTKPKSKYDPADFLVPGQDHMGHSERLWCRVQPLHQRQVEIVVKSKNWPFRTNGDVLRWALVRGLKQLEQMENVQSFLGQADAINEIVRQELYMMEFSRLFDNLEKVISQHLAAGAKGEARKLVAITKAKVEAIEEPYWKSKCLEEMKRRFGHILEVKGINLVVEMEPTNGKTDADGDNGQPQVEEE